MKKLLFLVLTVLLPSMIYASTITLTPANGSVVHDHINLVVTVDTTTCRQAAYTKFYVDTRLEDVVKAQASQCVYASTILHSTLNDEYNVDIYAEVYSSTGTLLISSAHNTIRNDNTGLNASLVLSTGGVTVTRGKTISGPLTLSMSFNTGGLNGTWSHYPIIDGITENDGRGTAPFSAYAYIPVSSANYSAGTFYAPIVTFNTGTQIQETSAYNDGTGDTTLAPGGLGWGNFYYAIVFSTGTFCVASSTTNAANGTCIAPLTQGTMPSSNAFINFIQNPGQMFTSNVGNTFVLDTTYFADGRHRIVDHGSYANTQIPPLTPATTGFASSQITTANGQVHMADYPFTFASSVTLSGGTLPVQWNATMWVVPVSSDDFCFANSVSNAYAGICITGLSSQGTGPFAASFNIPSQYYGNSSAPDFTTQDVEWLTFHNGAVPYQLMTTSSHIVLIPGESRSIAPYIENCDGSTTTISASSVYYVTADTAIATVNSSGLVVAVSSGEVNISLIDNVHHRNSRVVVMVRPDHSSFRQLSKGHGILTQYTPGQSLWAVMPISALFYSLLQSTPTSRPYWQAIGMNAAGGLTYGDNPWNSDVLANGTTTYFVSTWWTGNPDYNPFIHTTPLLGNYFSGWDEYFQSGTGPSALKLQNIPIIAKSISIMENDMYPYSVAMEWTDEADSRFGLLSNPPEVINSFSDGVDTGPTLGFQNVTVTGCAAAPCVSTTSVVNDIRFINSSAYYSTAYNCTHINGPYSLANVAYEHNSFKGLRIASANITTTDLVNGTYNMSTEGSSCSFKVNWEYYENYPSTIPGNTGGQVGGVLSNWDSQGPHAINVNASTTAVVTWTNFSTLFSTGVVFNIFNCSTGTLNGRYWIANSTGPNAFTIRQNGVPAMVYSSTDAASCQFDVEGILYPNRAYNARNNYLTANHAPMGWSITGGSGDAEEKQSWYPRAWSDYVSQNISTNPQDRYGPSNLDERILLYGNLRAYLVNGKMTDNLWEIDQPVVAISENSGQTCQKYSSYEKCVTDYPNADLYGTNGWSSPGSTFASAMAIIMEPNAVGSHPYGFFPDNVYQIQPSNGGGQVATQDGSFWADEHYGDQQTAMSSAYLFVQHEDKNLLTPPFDSPDMGQNMLMESSTHISSSCATVIMNWGDEQEPYTVNLSSCNKGGPMRMWTLTPFGDTVVPISSTITTYGGILPYSTAVAFISQLAGTQDQLTYEHVGYSTNSVVGATQAVLEVHYYLSDRVWQTVPCTNGICQTVGVNLHSMPVYYRLRYEDASGNTLATTDYQTWAAQ